MSGGNRPVVHVVGLGPGGPDLVTAGTLELLRGPIVARFLRTARHPAASVVTGAVTFDAVYDAAPDLDSVYRSIVATLIEAAEAEGRVLYAVPGSPVVAERTVELLRAQDRVDVVVHPALSFADLTWVRLGVDPVATGVRIVDGHDFAVEAAGERGPLLVCQCDSRFVLSDVKLAVEDPPSAPVTVLQRLGLPDEAVFEVAWEDLDRVVEPDHLTSLWVPQLGDPVAGEVARFDELMRHLRVADPWKAEQTHDSLKRFLLEETYEVLEAIDAYDPDTGDGAEELCEELGDLLYQVVFHSAIGTEAGWFSLADVARSIHDKLVGRHDALVRATGGATGAAAPAEALALWESAKRAEKARGSVLDGIPVAMPALARALKVAKKADALGAPAGDLGAVRGALARLAEAGDVDSATAAAGDALLALVDVARRAGVDPEDALRRAVEARIAALRVLEGRGGDGGT